MEPEPHQSSSSKPLGIGGSSRSTEPSLGYADALWVIGAVVIVMLAFSGVFRGVCSRVRGPVVPLVAVALGIGVGIAFSSQGAVYGAVAAWTAVVTGVPLYLLQKSALRRDELVQAEFERRTARLEAEDTAERERGIESLAGKLQRLREAIALEAAGDEAATHKAQLQLEIQGAREELELLRAYRRPRPAPRIRRRS